MLQTYHRIEPVTQNANTKDPSLLLPAISSHNILTSPLLEDTVDDIPSNSRTCQKSI